MKFGVCFYSCSENSFLRTTERTTPYFIDVDMNIVDSLFVSYIHIHIVRIHYTYIICMFYEFHILYTILIQSAKFKRQAGLTSTVLSKQSRTGDMYTVT